MLEKPPYLFVGDGRLAGHLSAYFNLLSISYKRWSRKEGTDFLKAAKGTSKIILCINDDAIEDFIAQHAPQLEEKIVWIHCSGSLSTPLAQGAHPLMTFGEHTMSVQEYQNIPFITEKGRANFKELFPELKNPTYEVKADLKNFYHAWCVLAGNFSTILWQNFFDVCEKRFEMPRHVAFPYLEKVTEQLQRDATPLTGPLARGDAKTVQGHLDSLEGEPFQDIYAAFVKTFAAINQKDQADAQH
tara:strand:+ start:115 stop:846 length:732 start_codon:yes stop_codon:yes gene_type:complete